MIIKNKETGKNHTTTKSGWSELGKMQNLFSIVDATDDEPVQQRIKNVADKPTSQSVKDAAKTDGPVKNTGNQERKQERPATGEKK